jgi:N-acetyl-gamma-glutamyl-phosphate reductase
VEGVGKDDIAAAYEKYYKAEFFIGLLPYDVPAETRFVEGSNYEDISFKVDERTGRVIVMAAIDNLVKGAAGQAVQNMNLLFGLDERTGLTQAPMFP